MVLPPDRELCYPKHLIPGRRDDDRFAADEVLDAILMLIILFHQYSHTASSIMTLFISGTCASKVDCTYSFDLTIRPTHYKSET